MTSCKHNFRCKKVVQRIGYVALFLFIACKQHKNSDSDFKIETSEDSLRRKINGKWGNREAATSPVWRFNYDSIYYYESSTAYPYKIVNGDIIISLPASKAILGKVSVINDTLFFIDPNEPSIPIRADRLPN